MTEARQDSAFYTNEAGHEVVWSDAEKPRFYVIRNGEMRIHYSPDLESQQVIRYTDQLEAIGVKTDADLEKFNDLGDEMFTWVNNSWFEVLDSNDSEYYSEPYHSLADAIGQAEVLHAEYGADREVD
jgi:hypothetical protein